MVIRFLQAATLAVLGATFALAASDITIASGVTVAPGESVILPVTLTAPAGSGGVYISLSSADSSIATMNPSLILVREGDTMPIRQPQVSGVNFGTAAITASAYGLTGDTETVRIATSLIGTQSTQIQRATTQNVSLVLSSPTPSQLILSVSSDNPAVASVPSSAVIQANQTAFSVPITGVGAGSTVVHINGLPAVAQKDINVTVVAPGTITLPSSLAVPLGNTAPFPVILGTPAPDSGVTVSFASSDISKMTISPASVFIPAGQTSPVTQPQVTAVDLGGVTITASAPGYSTSSASVGITATLAFTNTNVTVSGTGLQKVVLALSASAPWVTGVTAQLTSSNPNVAIVAPTVNFFPDGSATNSIIVIVQPIGPGTTTITASVPPFIAPASMTMTVLGASGGSPAFITATGGTPQTTIVNTAFGAPLAATVTDAGGLPVSGALVQFQAPVNGPTALFVSATAVNTAVTNALGVATSGTAVANGVPGSYAVSATVAGVPNPAIFSLTNASPSTGAVILPANTSLAPGQQVPFPVSLSVPAPAGGAVITLAPTDVSTVTILPQTVSVAPGSTVPAVQPVVTGLNFGNVTINGSAPGYMSANQIIKVSGTLAFQPSALTIHGSGAQSLNLTLSAPAPASGLLVSLSSNNSAAAGVASSITFPAGVSSVPVVVTGVAPGIATITAHSGAPNVADGSATVTVVPGSDITIASGVTVAPGESVILPVTLTAPAGSGGVYISLASADSSIATMNPSLILVREGDTMPIRQPQVSGVNFGTAAITASAYGLTGDTETVRIATSLIGTQSTQIQRATTQNVSFVLSSPTPSQLILSVSSDNPAVASVPSSAVIQANQTAFSVPITGVGAGSTVVHINGLPAVAQKDINVTVVAPGNITLPSSLAVPLGNTAPFPVILGTPAPDSGVTVSFASSDISKMTISPASVFIPAGQTSPVTQPQVTAVDLGGVTITASAPGYSTSSASVGITATLAFTNTNVTVSGTGLQKVVLALSASAPWVTGVTAQLTSSNPNVAIVAPTVNFFPDGSATNSIIVIVQPIGPGTTTITASVPPFIAPASMTMTVLATP